MSRLCLMLLVLACAVNVMAADLPTLDVEAAATPVRTSRMFQWALGPKPDGGWVFIAGFLNYKGTTSFTFERKPVPDTDRTYVAFADPAARPEAEWVVLDPAAGTSKTFRWPGFHATRSVRAANGRVFLGVDFMHILYYEPADGTVKMLGQISEWVPFTNDRAFYRMQLGPDGMVYCTTQAYDFKTALIRINPDTLETLMIDDVGTGERKTKLTYGYYLGVDPPWAYVAVGQNEWELMAVNLDTREIRCLARRTGERARVTVSQGKDFIGAELHGGGRKERVYCVDGAISAEKPTTPPISAKTYAGPEWKDTKPLDAGAPPLIERAKVTIDRTGLVTVPWRPADQPKADATLATFRIASTEPAPIESLLALPDGSVLGNAKQYNGFFRYHPADNRLDYFGKHGPSQVVSVRMNGRVYFCGYPNCNLWEYDPAKPWTSDTTRATPGDKTRNPWLIGYFGQTITEAHHCRFLAPGPNGRIYILGHRERWSTGAGLGFYEFATDQKVGLGEANKDIDPRGLVVLPGLKRVVVSGRMRGNDDTDATLRVYDLDLQEVERLPIKPGLKTTGHLTPVAGTDRVIGLIDTPEMHALYLYDVKEKALVTWVDFETGMVGAPFRRNDGSLWLVRTDRALCRVDPETLALTPVGMLAEPIAADHVWLGDRLYGATGGELRRTTADVDK